MTDPGWTEVHALSGAYAVDALDDLEKARFEEHLRRCAECRAEVDSLREAAATLSIDPAFEVAPPPSLRGEVLAGIEEIRPLPPLTDHDRPVVPMVRRRRWSGAPLLVAAALVLVALAATAWLRPWQDDTTTLTAADRVIRADDAVSHTEELPDGSRATVYLSRSEGRAVLRTEDMAPAPDGKVYELWLQTPQGAMEPAGLMPDDPDTTVLLDGDASAAVGVGVTVEPDGGSKQPSSDPILLFPLAD